jgi:hypothetical protein
MSIYNSNGVYDGFCRCVIRMDKGYLDYAELSILSRLLII